MAIGIAGSGAAHARNSAGGATTIPGAGSIDTSGASLLVANITTFAPSGSPTLTVDSLGNTWTAKTARSVSINLARPFYKDNPTVGSGHTITTASSSNYEGEWAAFTGISTSSPFISESAGGTGSSITSLQPGSITPGQNALLITGIASTNSGDTYAIDSSFSITDQHINTASAGFGGALAWKESSGAENPAWSWPTSTAAAAWQMAFKDSGGAVAASASNMSMMGI